MNSRRTPPSVETGPASTAFDEGLNSDLGDWDSQPLPPRPRAPAPSTGALWIEDLGVVGAGAQPTANAADRLAAGPVPAAGVATQKAAGRITPSNRNEAPKADFDLGAEMICAPDRPSVAGAAAKAAQKSAVRAEVRRRLLRWNPSPGDRAPATPEVLLLAARGPSRDQLGRLLRDFGFGVHAISDPVGATALVAFRSFVAVFLSVEALNASAIELCQRLRQSSRGRPGGALILVAARLRAIDRVRAGLSGCDDAILSPASPGAVARALESRGILLPADGHRG